MYMVTPPGNGIEMNDAILDGGSGNYGGFGNSTTDRKKIILKLKTARGDATGQQPNKKKQAGIRSGQPRHRSVSP